MKSSFVYLGAGVGVLLLGTLLLRGQAGDAAGAVKKERRIDASGTATIAVKPDAARVFFAVQSIAPAIRAAREDNQSKVQKVIEALRALKIPDLKMKTSDVNVELLHSRHNEDRLPQIIGFRITTSFTVLVSADDPDKLSAAAGRVLDTGLENGVNIMQQIVFLKQDTTAVQQQALSKAVENALANARALAAGAGVKIQETITVNGQPQISWGGRQDFGNTVQVAVPAAESSIIVGDLKITCNASVTCTY